MEKIAYPYFCATERSVDYERNVLQLVRNKSRIVVGAVGWSASRELTARGLIIISVYYIFFIRLMYAIRGHHITGPRV